MARSTLFGSFVFLRFLTRLIPSFAVVSFAGAALLTGCVAPNQDADALDLAGAADEPDPDEQAIGSCGGTSKYCQYSTDWGFEYDCCVAGEVCGSYGCEPAPAPFVGDNGSITLGYQVLTLIYSPPGKKSSVLYKSLSSTGTHLETKKSFTQGASIGYQGLFADVTARFATTAAKGTSYELKKTTGSVVGSEASATRVNDEIDCNQDRLYLWIKPSYQVVETSADVFQLKVPGVKQEDIVQITMAEVKNPALITDWRASKLSHMRSVDYQRLLSLNPCTSGETLSTPRYQLVDERDLTGPSQAGDDIPISGTVASNEVVKGQFTLAAKEVSVEVVAKIGIPHFGPKLTLGGEWTFGHENKQETTTGEAQEAEAILKTDTVGYHAVYRVYYDTIFRTFAFKKLTPPSGSVTVAGNVYDANGLPMAGAEVAIVQSNGVKRHVNTDQNGHYEAYYVTQGTTTVTSNGMTQSAYVGTTGAEVDLGQSSSSQ